VAEILESVLCILEISYNYLDLYITQAVSQILSLVQLSKPDNLNPTPCVSRLSQLFIYTVESIPPNNWFSAVINKESGPMLIPLASGLVSHNTYMKEQ
jgi:hypothetical protein